MGEAKGKKSAWRVTIGIFREGEKLHLRWGGGDSFPRNAQATDPQYRGIYFGLEIYFPPPAMLISIRALFAFIFSISH
jgi:hypothetical protein